MIKNFFNAIKLYFKNADFNSIDFWLPLIISALVIYLIWIITTKFVFKNREHTFNKVFLIYKSLVFSSFFTALGVIVFICINFNKNHYINYHDELSHLLTLLFALLTGIISFLILRRFYKNDSIKEIIKLAKTQSTKDKFYTNAKRTFAKMKLFVLIPFLGFIALIFRAGAGNNLISIVLDNSSSMTTPDQNLGGKSYLDVSKDALTNTFAKLDDNNTIVITTFKGEGKGLSTFDEITKITNPNELMGVTVQFNSVQEAINYCSQFEGKSLTPLTEAIWQNYLFCKNIASSYSLRNKILIIISDGGDNINQQLINGKFLCDVNEFNSFFSQETVHIIDIRGSFENGLTYSQGIFFLNRANSCGYDIINGSTMEEYSSALQKSLKDFMRDYNILYWAFLLLIISSFVSLLIQPKRAH